MSKSNPGFFKKLYRFFIYLRIEKIQKGQMALHKYVAQNLNDIDVIMKKRLASKTDLSKNKEEDVIWMFAEVDRANSKIAEMEKEKLKCYSNLMPNKKTLTN